MDIQQKTNPNPKPKCLYWILQRNDLFKKSLYGKAFIQLDIQQKINPNPNPNPKYLPIFSKKLTLAITLSVYIEFYNKMIYFSNLYMARHSYQNWIFSKILTLTLTLSVYGYSAKKTNLNPSPQCVYWTLQQNNLFLNWIHGKALHSAKKN